MLKPEASLTVGLASAALAVAIFQGATPKLADGRSAPPNDQDYEASTRLAAWTAAGVVAGISLLAKDPTVFTIGGAVVIGLTWWHRHANLVDPSSGKAAAVSALGGAGDVTQAEDPGAYGYDDNYAYAN